MKPSLRIVVAAAIGVAATVSTAAPAPATSGYAPVMTAVYQRNDGLESYTFHMAVAMAMRHFPWLHFRMQGIGDYRRGEHYTVHLTSVPSFASKMHDIDLSMIDPTMWPGRYRYEVMAEQGGDTLFALQALQDPSLKSATVALNPLSGAHWVDATYSDGMHVHMVVNSSDIDGFLLPATLTADVDYPHMPLSANASFTDYSISPPAR